ncbi:hypothetical protein EZJ28_00815 [Gramella sp. KN1008]|nr:hypothetical protein EZJ28_00815 [Gramella sp. KN1008]
MDELRLTGGARLGMANATFPLASLKVNENRLELNAGIVGNLTFQPSDIISIEAYTMIPIIGQGIKINHRVSSYKERVIFWSFKDPDSVVRQIRETGFLKHTKNNPEHIPDIPNHMPDRSLIQKQSKGGFPLKMGFAVGAIIAWNLFFLIDFLDFFSGEKKDFSLGIGAFTAVGLLFLTSFLSLISTGFCQLILKEGRDLQDIKRFAVFVMIVSGFMLLNLGIFSLFFK